MTQPTNQPQQLTPFRLAGLTFLLVFLLYGLTLAPGLVGGDAGEHQLAVPLLGIPHTTGYPLYILTGKLWTVLIPVGSLAWRVNLFSAFGGALAAALTTLVVYRLSPLLGFPKGGDEIKTPPSGGAGGILWAGPFVAGLALACGLTLWQWSTIAGVRSFNVFFFALLTLEAIIWRQQRQRGEGDAAARTLRWLALTVGLSLAHHRTTVFYLPALIGWIGWYDRALLRQPKRLLLLTLLTLAPLTLYLFIYLRGINDPPYTHEQITDLESFWFLVGSGDSSGLFFSIDPAFLPARLSFIWADILKQLSWPGVILAQIGCLWLMLRRPAHFLLQGSLVLLLLLFTLDFEVVNLNEAPTWYLMPAYFIFAVWLGLGLNWLLSFVLRPLSVVGHPSSVIRLPSPRMIQLLFTIVTLALLAYSLAWPNWQRHYEVATAPLNDWRQLLRGTQAQRFVESSLPYIEPNAIIWGDWEQYTPFKYAQLIDGKRPDLTARNPLDRWPEKVAAARKAEQPIYFTRKPPDLIGTPHLSMAGPLIYLGAEPIFDPPADIVSLGAKFEDQLELIGYRAEIIPQQAAWADQASPSILQVMLYWCIPQPVAWDYALSLRLLDEAGQELYRRDATHPVLSSYPTTLWTPGEVVGDFYELPYPTDHGPLRLHILPYRTEGPGQWHNLILEGTQPPQEGIMLGPFDDPAITTACCLRSMRPAGDTAATASFSSGDAAGVFLTRREIAVWPDH